MSQPSLAEQSGNIASRGDTADDDEQGLALVHALGTASQTHLVNSPNVRDEDDASLVASVSGFAVGDPEQQQRKDTTKPNQSGNEGEVNVRSEDYH